MALRAAGKTDVGLVRHENQDNFLVLQQQKLYAVADGMGGHAGGKRASEITVEVLQYKLGGAAPESSAAKAGENAGNDGSDKARIDKARVDMALAAANSMILEESREKQFDGMGTTLVLAFPADGFWHIAHIGDSRAYAFGGGAIRPLTKDHSLVEELLAQGSITPEEAKDHPHRNILTRALGVGDKPETEWGSIPVSEAEYLLLCSDGLYNMVDEDKMCSIVVSESLTLEGKTEALIEEAKRQGGYDNITAVIVARGAEQ